jgi:AraC-like DNA-binding protein
MTNTTAHPTASEAPCAFESWLINPRVFATQGHVMHIAPQHGARDLQREHGQPFAQPADLHVPLCVKYAGYSAWFPGDWLERTNWTDFGFELIVAGTCEFVTEGTRYLLKPNDAFLLHEGEAHTYKAMSGGILTKLYVTLTRESSHQLARMFGLTGIACLPLPPAAAARFKELHAQMLQLTKERLPGYMDKASLYSYEMLLLLKQAAYRLPATSHYPESLVRALVHVRAHLSESANINDLARIAACSTTQLYRVFTKHLGMAPHEWLEKVKTCHAAFLLRTSSLPVYIIGERVGYQDPYHFSVTFKRVVGMSPSEFREKNQMS